MLGASKSVFAVVLTDREDKGIDNGTLDHVDSPGDTGHLRDVLVSLCQVLHQLLHHLVTSVSDWKKQLCKLLHVLKHKHTHTHLDLGTLRVIIFNHHECFCPPSPFYIPLHFILQACLSLTASEVRAASSM